MLPRNHPTPSAIPATTEQTKSGILVERGDIRPDADLALGRRLALHVDGLLAAVLGRAVRGTTTGLAGPGARRRRVVPVVGAADAAAAAVGARLVVLVAALDVDLAPAAALVHHVEPRQLVGAQAAAGARRVPAELVVRPAAVRAAQQGRSVALGERLERGNGCRQYSHVDLDRAPVLCGGALVS